MNTTGIKKLAIGTHPLPAYPGLRIVVTATNRNFTYRFRDGRDKLKQVKLGDWPDMSLAGAVAKWEELRTEKHRPAKVTHTVKELVDAYCVEHLQARRKDPMNRVQMLYRHLGDLWNVEAATVGRVEAHALLSGLKDKPAVQRLMKVEMAACWDMAIATGRLTSEANPWRRVPVAPTKARQRVFSDAELALMLKWLPKSKLTQGMQTIFMLVLLTGMRAGEVCSMHWSGVDLEAGTYALKGADTKTGTGRTVQLSTWAVKLLSNWKRGSAGDNAWVFPNRSGKGSTTQPIYSNALWTAREDCPVTDWCGHDGRRTCRTHLAMLGCPDSVGEAVLGHKPAGIIGVYQTYRFDAEQKEWLEKWGAKLMALAA